MASCPICQNKLFGDFGNEVCSNCGATVFVESEDIVKVQDLDALDAALKEINKGESESVNLEAQSVLTADDENTFETPDEVGEDESFKNDFIKDKNSVEGSTSESLEESQDEDDIIEDPFLVSSTEEEILENNIMDDGALSSETSTLTDPLADLDRELDVNKVSIPSTTAEDFFSEMQLLGDMDSEKFKESNYFFDIEIKGIDSKDIREEVLDHLFDSRLGLKENDLDKKIKNGFLLLNDISAIKTHVIVQSLSHLPCEISWKIKEVFDLGLSEEQDLVSATESEEIVIDEFDDI